jgi:predicted dehydrogenase
MKKAFGVGIIGTGWIARKMARTLQGMESAELRAVASRSQAMADAFAAEWGSEGTTHAYGSYEAIVDDPEVELVYIATPHPMHHGNAMMCIEGGKPVLCEKPFTVNAREADDVFDLARRRGVFAAEAIWTRYVPMSQTIREIVESGAIGAVKMVTANLGYPNSHMERMRNPALGGGALLDLGVYTINFAAMVLPEDPVDIAATCTRFESGVDAQNSITLTWAGGQMAILSSSLTAKTDRQAVISGEKGHLIVENINNPESVTVIDADYRRVARYEQPPQITGFEHQVQAAMDAIRTGRIETPFMPHAETLRMMRLMDTVRRGWGLRYPFE